MRLFGVNSTVTRYYSARQILSIAVISVSRHEVPPRKMTHPDDAALTERAGGQCDFYGVLPAGALRAAEFERW